MNLKEKAENDGTNASEREHRMTNRQRLSQSALTHQQNGLIFSQSGLVLLPTLMSDLWY